MQTTLTSAAERQVSTKYILSWVSIRHNAADITAIATRGAVSSVPVGIIMISLLPMSFATASTGRHISPAARKSPPLINVNGSMQSSAPMAAIAMAAVHRGDSRRFVRGEAIDIWSNVRADTGKTAAAAHKEEQSAEVSAPT